MGKRGKMKSADKAFRHDIHFYCDDATKDEAQAGAKRFESFSAYMRYLIHQDAKPEPAQYGVAVELKGTSPMSGTE